MRLNIWPLFLLLLCLPLHAQMIAAEQGENLPPVNMTDMEDKDSVEPQRNSNTSDSQDDIQMQEERPRQRTRPYYNDEEDAETQEYIDENFDNAE